MHIFRSAYQATLFALLIGFALPKVQAQMPSTIIGFSPTGELLVRDTYANGVCCLLQSASTQGPWSAARNRYTTADEARMPLDPVPERGTAFFKVATFDLDPTHGGIENLYLSYSTLSTIAGAGGVTTKGFNKWLPQYEGGPATAAQLSRPHMAMSDSAGNIYVADKDAHAIRRIDTDGIIYTAAGINTPGNGPDGPTTAKEVALSSPNGLWVTPQGIVFILDLDNGKIRRLTEEGVLSTFITVPGGIAVGRGLWVSDDERVAYIAAGTVVKKWTVTDGISDFASGFVSLGNLVIDPTGRLVVTDRGAHRVYRFTEDGDREVIAGNGLTTGGGDGELAVETGLDGVRAVWFLPTGAFLVGTHSGSQVWHVDTYGVINLFVQGSSSHDSHAGDGSHFFKPNVPCISEVRAVTLDHEGNVLITEHDAGYIRRIRFLPEYF